MNYLISFQRLIQLTKERVQQLAKETKFQLTREVEIKEITIAGLKMHPKPDEETRLPPTRIGVDEKDKSTPFYNSSNDIYGYYGLSSGDPEYDYRMPYADTVYLKPENMEAADVPCADVQSIRISIDRRPYELPLDLRKHGNRAVELFKKLGRIKKNSAGEYQNDSALRVDSFSPNEGLFKCRPVSYFDQVATNLTIDWASGGFLNCMDSIRNSIERRRGKLPPLDKSVLANSLGVAVMLYTRNLQPLIRVRSKDNAAMIEGGFHCSASGVWSVEFPPDKKDFDFNLFAKGIRAEIRSEIGLEDHEYLLYPTAFSRELPRGGKPQLFFTAVSLVSDKRLTTAMEDAEERVEYISDEINPAFQQRLKLDTKEIEMHYTYEGWTCFRLSDIFIKRNRQAIQDLIGRNSDPAR